MIYASDYKRGGPWLLSCQPNPGYTPVTVGELIGSYFIYRGTSASGIHSYSSRVETWRDLRFITRYLL